jgi:hypothetical protein
MKPISSHAIQAIAFILLCQNGIDAVDACNALLDAQAANQLARAARNEADAMNAAVDDITDRNRKPGDPWVPGTSAIQILKSGWLPDGWES